jgi:dihydrofolate reductase
MRRCAGSGPSSPDDAGTSWQPSDGTALTGFTTGIFGASLSRQCLQAGLLDEIVLHVAPVLLGGGVRLFGDDGTGQIELERVSLGEAEQLTDLRFRVLK